MGGDGGEDASAAWRLFFHRVGALPATVLDDAVARAHRGAWSGRRDGCAMVNRFSSARVGWSMSG